MKLFSLLLTFSTLTLSTSILAGHMEGNGGDFCAQINKMEIEQFIHDLEIVNPSSLNEEEKNRLITRSKNVEIFCTDKELCIDGVTKDAKNFPAHRKIVFCAKNDNVPDLSRQKKAVIVFNRNSFELDKNDFSKRLLLQIHELLGTVGLDIGNEYKRSVPLYQEMMDKVSLMSFNDIYYGYSSVIDTNNYLSCHLSFYRNPNHEYQMRAGNFCTHAEDTRFKCQSSDDNQTICYSLDPRSYFFSVRPLNSNQQLEVVNRFGQDQEFYRILTN